MRQLTKDDILRGRSTTERFFIEELDGEIPLRPLTDTQWTQVQATMSAGIKGRGKPGQRDADMEFDVGDVQRQMHKAKCLAICYAIADGSHWTVAEIERADWPPGTVDKIAAIVLRLTGVEFSLGEVRRFRGKSGWSGDSNLATLRGSAGDAAGRADNVADGVFEGSVAEGVIGS